VGELLATGVFQETKRDALERTADPDFWSRPERFEVLGVAEFVDRIEAGFETAGTLLRRLTGDRERVPRHLVERLAQQLFLLETACGSLLDDEPRDAFLLVEAAPDTAAQAPANDRLAETLATMYRRWANKRRMALHVLDEGSADALRPYRMLAAVSGYGAHRLLAPESGLHVFEAPDESQPPGRRYRRDKARVVVLGQPDAPAGAGPDDLRRQAEEALTTAEPSTRVVRRYRREPSPLVRDAVRGWRTGRLDRVLDGDFDLFG
jgi:ATP-dependent Clp protease ATP-binding subunit ClpC